MTRASAAASTPLSTITRRPPVSTISIRPDASTGHDEDGEFSGGSIRSGNDGRPLVEGSQLITACANIAPLSTSTRRPSRARRRHVNSWLADSPFRRAVADTCRRPSWLSLTIRRFSSNVQRRRAPVPITSSRHTFDIVVRSILRLSLHLLTQPTRRYSAQGYAFTCPLVDPLARPLGRLASPNRNLTVSTAGKSAQERSEWDDRFMRRVWLRLSSSSRAGADRVFGYCDR